MGAVVHSGALALAWTDIDLTRDTAGAGTGVPPTRCLVRLRITPTSGFSWYAVRPSDDAGNWCPTSVDGHGTSDAAISFVAGRSGEVWAATGPDGHVDIYCVPAAAATVSVVGWLGTATYSGATIHAGVVPLAWTDLDTSIGARGFVFLRDLHTAGWSQDHALRPDGDAGDYLVAGQVGGCSHGKIQAAANVHGFSLETDASGILEHISNVGGAGALSTQIEMLYAVLEGAGWASVGSTVFAAAAPPVAWTALDLTSEIGTYSGPVKLRVHLAAGAPQRQVSFRPGGSALDMRGSAGYAGGTQFVDLGADEVGTVDIEAESGVVEWIASSAVDNIDLVLVGLFAASPVVTGTAPTPGAVSVPPTAPIRFTCADDDTGIDPTTIELDLTDPTMGVASALVAGVWQAGYDGSITADGSGGYVVICHTHPQMDLGAWSAEARAQNGYLVLGSDTWSWTVAAGAVTWSDLAAAGSGHVVYILEVAGVGVFSTYDYIPTDAWFAANDWADDDVYPWLMWESVGPYQEQIDHIESRIEIGALNLDILDVGGALTAMIADWRARNTCRLVATLPAGDPGPMTVTDTSAFAAAGEVHVGQEVVAYNAKAATEFQTLTRGLYGTPDRTHYVDTTSDLPDQPVVADGLHFIVGRRCWLHAAVIDPATGFPGPTTIIYRGRVAKGIRIGSGTWSIPVEHISAVLKEKTAQNLPQSMIRQGYYYTGSGPSSTNLLVILDAAGVIQSEDEITVSEGWYTPEELRVEWEAQSRALAADITPYIMPGDGGKYRLEADLVALRKARIYVFPGTPLWALGFDEGYYEGPLGAQMEHEAQSLPRRLVVDWVGAAAGSLRPVIEVENAAAFTVDTKAQIPGWPFAEIYSATGATGRVTLKGGTMDWTRGETYTALGRWGHDLWTVDDEADMLLRQVFTFSDQGSTVRIRQALQRMLYLDAGQVEPEIWCSMGCTPSTHTHGEDFDWDELDAALAGVPDTIQIQREALTEGAEPLEVIGSVLAMLGIAPRITSEGRIGWTRLQTPIATAAISVALDSAVWSVLGAAQVEARLDDSPLVNVVNVQHSHDYTQESGGGGAGGNKEGWGPPIKIEWREGINALGKKRSVKYQTPGVIVSPHFGHAPDTVVLAQDIDVQVRATHFGIFGREACTVDIPCVWTSKQIRCGDIVEVTHELAPDTVEGAIGVTDRLGLVVGRIWQLGTDGEDVLSVRFGGRTNSGGIAPCAHGDSWVVGTLTMSFSGAATPLYEVTGGNDLTRFETMFDAGETDVLLIERDSLAPATWAAKMVSVDPVAGEVVFFADPFGGGGLPAGGVWLTIPTWDLAADGQQRYAFIADVAATPSLGAGSDEAMEWVI